VRGVSFPDPPFQSRTFLLGLKAGQSLELFERNLVGFALPDWDKAMATVLAAAAYLPGFGMQSWDVALCADGPMLLELNVVGDVNLAQHAFGRGVFEGRLAELYRQGRR